MQHAYRPAFLGQNNEGQLGPAPVLRECHLTLPSPSPPPASPVFLSPVPLSSSPPPSTTVTTSPIFTTHAQDDGFHYYRHSNLPLANYNHLLARSLSYNSLYDQFAFAAQFFFPITDRSRTMAIIQVQSARNFRHIRATAFGAWMRLAGVFSVRSVDRLIHSAGVGLLFRVAWGYIVALNTFSKATNMEPVHRTFQLTSLTYDPVTDQFVVL